jgi:predicted transcriptional regulator
VTWDPCPSKMNRYPFVMDIPLVIDLFKKKKLERKVIVHAFDCLAIQVLGLQNYI